jgi:hypothetical protein
MTKCLQLFFPTSSVCPVSSHSNVLVPTPSETRYLSLFFPPFTTPHSSHATKTMAQIRGTAGYHLGSQPTSFGGSGQDATNDPSPLDAIREQTSKIEDWLDTLSHPVKP